MTAGERWIMFRTRQLQDEKEGLLMFNQAHPTAANLSAPENIRVIDEEIALLRAWRAELDGRS